MEVKRCRVCNHHTLHAFLDLGNTALANRFLRPEQIRDPEPRFPLRVVLCESCGLIQIDEEVPPEILFRDYIYVSGTSELIFTHAATLASHFVGRYRLKPEDLVLEVASNDGTVLRAFRKHGVRTLGIEPAQNIAERANAEGIDTLCEFFNVATSRKVLAEHGRAQLILARHVLAHVADLHGFVEGLRIALADDGVVAVEVPHLLCLHDNLEYDTIYHEHLCYFSVRVLRTLFDAFGLEVIDVQEAAIHGGSVVVTAQHRNGPHRVQSSIGWMIDREDRAGLHRLATWKQFARRVAQSRETLLEEIYRLRAAGCSVAGYGAPAKGMTLLSYCNLGPAQLPYLVDRSPYKQGRFTPGHHIPVHAPDRLLLEPPDVVLLLAWNFASEIVNQQAVYRAEGGEFLLPIPEAHYWMNRSPDGNADAGRDPALITPAVGG